MRRLHETARPTIDALRALQNGLEPVLRQQEAATTAWRSAIAELEHPMRLRRDALALANADMARQVAETARASNLQWTQDLARTLGSQQFRISTEIIDALSRAIAEEVSTALEGQADTRFTEDLDIPAVAAMDAADRLADRFSTLGISNETILNLVFAVLLYLMAARDAATNQTELQHGLANVIARLESIEANAGEDEWNQYYYTNVATRLRSEPNTSSDIIFVIPSDYLLEVFDQQGRWLFVEGYDPNEDVYQMGWVYKRNLRDASE